MDFIHTDGSGTLVVAPDYLGDVQRRREWLVIKADNRTGLQQLHDDIERRVLNVNELHHLMILLGRDDVLCGCNMEVVLVRLLNRIRSNNELVSICLTGPVARCHDHGSILDDLCEARRMMRKVVSHGEASGFPKLPAYWKMITESELR